MGSTPRRWVPASPSEEVLGGYWIIQVKSKAEAIEWASRCPASDNETIEIRQVFDMSDFPPDVHEVAAQFPDSRAAAAVKALG